MILRQIFESHRREGLTGLFERSALYCVRRLSWRSAAWTGELERLVAVAGLSKEGRELAKRNAAFRGRHKGKPCFVIGNGPSINTQNLSPLADQITLVTNAFWKHPIVERWQPTYCFLTDPVFFEQSESVRKFFSEMSARISESTFFVPHYARELITSEALLDQKKTYYITSAGVLENGLAGIPDLAGIVPGGRAVTQLAIMAAMFMGCSPIYLLGLDHDWLSRRGAHLTFYNEKVVSTERSLDDWRYGDLMESVLVIWRGYVAIFKVALRENIRIINATRGGFLDVFERADYDSIVGNRPAG
jgi:hypothetical protein